MRLIPLCLLLLWLCTPCVIPWFLPNPSLHSLGYYLSAASDRGFAPVGLFLPRPLPSLNPSLFLCYL
jgi:hypothetical protein